MRNIARDIEVRALAFSCLLIALLLAGFAYWGLYTAAGGRAYDEMAGMIPFFAALASPFFLILAAMFGWFGRRRRMDG